MTDDGMTAPAATDYAAFAHQLTSTGLVTDPWVDGAPRFRSAPLLLSGAEYQRLGAAAESVAAVLDELGRIVADDEILLDTFFALTPAQKLMWQASAPLWHAFARADVFVRRDGTPVVCEVNCDTPSGLAEAVCLSQLSAHPASVDPNVTLGEAWRGVVARFAARAPTPAGETSVAAIVYPTELGEDLALISLYRRWCEAAGHEVVVGSPYNLVARPDGGVAMFGRPCQLIVRHYKTDWWGERLPIWDDEEPYPDPEPLALPLSALLRAELGGLASVVNPFGAVLPQNKRAFAFCWEALDRFSADAQEVIRTTIPYTVRLESADGAALRADRAGWVLKSDYGCEGEEVIIGRQVSEAIWNASLEHAVPARWVAQRYFDGRTDENGWNANHGVFLAGGLAVGLYTRLSSGATDHRALSVATRLTP